MDTTTRTVKLSLELEQPLSSARPAAYHCPMLLNLSRWSSLGVVWRWFQKVGMLMCRAIFPASSRYRLARGSDRNIHRRKTRQVCNWARHHPDRRGFRQVRDPLLCQGLQILTRRICSFSDSLFGWLDLPIVRRGILPSRHLIAISITQPSHSVQTSPS